MRKFVFLLAAAGACGLVHADGNSVEATAKASAHIAAPLKVISNSDLNFGNIVVDSDDIAASVLMKVDMADYQVVCTPTLSDWVKCAPFKHQGNISGASFHYSFDALAEATYGVKVSYPESINLSGGHGPDCKVTLNSSLPADDCLLVDPGLDPYILGVIHKKHFGVGGKLDIPAGALGTKTGELTVTVEYL